MKKEELAFLKKYNTFIKWDKLLKEGKLSNEEMLEIVPLHVLLTIPEIRNKFVKEWDLFKKLIKEEKEIISGDGYLYQIIFNTYELSDEKINDIDGLLKDSLIKYIKGLKLEKEKEEEKIKKQLAHYYSVLIYTQKLSIKWLEENIEAIKEFNVWNFLIDKTYTGEEFFTKYQDYLSVIDWNRVFISMGSKKYSCDFLINNYKKTGYQIDWFINFLESKAIKYNNFEIAEINNIDKEEMKKELEKFCNYLKLIK